MCSSDLADPRRDEHAADGCGDSCQNKLPKLFHLVFFLSRTEFDTFDYTMGLRFTQPVPAKPPKIKRERRFSQKGSYGFIIAFPAQVRYNEKHGKAPYRRGKKGILLRKFTCFAEFPALSLGNMTMSHSKAKGKSKVWYGKIAQIDSIVPEIGRAYV